MMSIELYIGYVLACAAVVIVPGPTVTVIIANSLRYGPRAGLVNVAGTQAGLFLLLIILAFGLDYIVANLAYIFDWIRLAGAAYLIWLGIKLWRDRGHSVGLVADAGSQSQKSFFVQGLLVILSNPKALLFFGAFIPQFVDPSGDAVVQTLWLGLTFMGVATILDGAYAVLTGSASRMVTPKRISLLNKISGSALIGGGIWLALSRR